MKLIVIFTIFAASFIQFECKPKNVESTGEIVGNKQVARSTGNSRNRQDKEMKKEDLAKRVAAVDETVSKIILDESSEIKVLETPFLKDGNVYLVSNFAPTRMIEIYLGISGEDFTELIGGDGEKYNKFLKRAGLVLDNSELRSTYIVNYLEVTDPGGDRFQILDGIDDIKKRPNLDENQELEFAEFYEKYKSVISELKQTESNKFRAYVIIGQNLVRYDLTIGSDSLIEKTETLLEENLLIPYAL